MAGPISLDVDDTGLMTISRDMQLSLSLDEMKALKKYYHALGRSATGIELETFAQTWSEHCCHKTFRGEVEFEGKIVSNLLKTTIAKVTSTLDHEWCFSVFEDNAGIVDFDGDTAIAFKVETHNHPSALEPFGGAATGVGGVIRDILGVWGEPIANTDVLCFGPLDYPYEKLPAGMKHPSFIYKYVTAGIGHYGNNMGIPTVNGAIYFDESYVGNPLVYCGTVGLVKKSRYKREIRTGDVMILAGGKTGRDGIHGVTFASVDLSTEQERSVVQIGDPIEEEKVSRAVISIRDKGLGSAITDLGGGGLSSAIGEMAELGGCGADVHLERVPLKHPGMQPWEIWTSESQERMLVCCHKKDVEAILGVFADEEVEAVVVAEFTEGERLRLMHTDTVVGEINISFLFGTNIRTRRVATPPERSFSEPRVRSMDPAADLLAILAMPNVASKENVIRTYDHEVKAQTVLKPLQGLDGPGDAAVLKPLNSSWKGVVISNGMNPEYGKIDPYHMAACAIDEAIRNNIAVGGRRIALLDNFCWGNPERPDRMWGLVRASQACHDVALAFETPFISGKDSLYNETELGPITPTLLISALGVMPDIRRAVSMDLKEEGNSIFIVGATKDELGGSHFYKLKGSLGKNVPMVDAASAKTSFDMLTKAIDSGCVRSCHDLSEGGLAVAASETCFAGGLGLELDLDKMPRKGELSTEKLLFSESQSRFLVGTDDSAAFEKAMADTVFSEIGCVTDDKRLRITRKAAEVLNIEIEVLKRSWKNGL
ncbi:phosphoribosylformylglycinamidine synthase 2 [archaeon BMS3Abin16]|nr:phosphoribosylformylglycinamidine synthase 2 [archaeon BMS3Abin16]HDY73677.1 phosphoribosylformylglycinamidine synthase subunit PurL [Euryarchaeota archaeon]